jgi:hypothetical protein
MQFNTTKKTAGNTCACLDKHVERFPVSAADIKPVIFVEQLIAKIKNEIPWADTPAISHLFLVTIAARRFN